MEQRGAHGWFVERGPSRSPSSPSSPSAAAHAHSARPAVEPSAPAPPHVVAARATAVDVRVNPREDGGACITAVAMSVREAGVAEATAAAEDRGVDTAGTVLDRTERHYAAHREAIAAATPWRSAVEAGESRVLTCDALLPGRFYEFCTRVRTDLGWSEWSQPSRVERTEGAVPPPNCALSPRPLTGRTP